MSQNFQNYSVGPILYANCLKNPNFPGQFWQKNIHQKIGRKSQFKKKSMLHVYYLHFNAIIMLVACGRKGRKKTLWENKL